MPSPRDHFHLEPDLAFLNHGSFGATPRPILELQEKLRVRIERQPVQFFVRELLPLLEQARTRVARFVKAPESDVVFVPNATTGVNTVLRSLRFDAGDELLVTDHEYNACRNALDFVAARSGARVVVAPVPFPLDDPAQVLEAIEARVTERTRLLLVDHVTSPTGLVLPIAEIVAAMEARGVETLVDGAHAPGMVPLDLGRLAPTYYTGNFHKWVSAAKGAAFLYVRPDRQTEIRPLVISHGANLPLPSEAERFQAEFSWTGTADPSPFLSLPATLEFMASLVDGGWAGLMAHNRKLTLAARDVLADALGIAPPCPDSMIGSLAALSLPDGDAPADASPLHLDPLQETLLETYRIEVPIFTWPKPPKRLIRISAQIYNEIGEYERLAEALVKELDL